jgi:hypothetical protein
MRQSVVKKFTLVEDATFNGVRHRAGDLVEMAVVPADVTNQTEVIDTYLGGYSQFGFAADLVSKVVPVDKEAGQRRDFAKENAFERVETRSGRNGAINEIDHQSTLTPYRVQEYALASFIPYSTETDAEKLYNIRAAAGELIMDKLLLDREYRIWGMLTTLANWNTANRTSLTTNFKWDNGSTKNIRGDIQARVRATLQPITDMYMNPDVAFWFLSDPAIIVYMRQMMGDNAPSADIAAAAMAPGGYAVESFTIPGLPRITIVPGKVMVAGTPTYILGDDVVLATNQPGIPTDGHRVATSWTFRHKGRSGVGVQTNEYIPQGRGLNSGTMFEAGFLDAEFIAAPQAGGLIKDVLST